MVRCYVAVLSLIVVLACGWSWSVADQGAGETVCIPIGMIPLAAPDGVEAKRSPVEFPHDLHFDYSCRTCHHQWDNSSQITACMECHDETESPSKALGRKAAPEEEVMYYKAAYHQLCIGCHKEIKTRNQDLAASGKVIKDQLAKTGPTSCNGCHPKE